MSEFPFFLRGIIFCLYYCTTLYSELVCFLRVLPGLYKYLFESVFGVFVHIPRSGIARTLVGSKIASTKGFLFTHCWKRKQNQCWPAPEQCCLPTWPMDSGEQSCGGVTTCFHLCPFSSAILCIPVSTIASISWAHPAPPAHDSQDKGHSGFSVSSISWRTASCCHFTN